MNRSTAHPHTVMTSCRLRCTLLVAGAALVAAPAALASVVVYGDADEAAWFAAAPQHATITFAEFAHFTPISDQYADLGVLFTDPYPNLILGPFPDSFLQDGWGLSGSIAVHLEFAETMVAFAAHFPGVAVFKFFLEGQMVFESAIMGSSGLDWFAGFSVAGGFDRLEITGKPPFFPGMFDPVHFDNFYFKAIPTPGALAALLLAGLGGGRRRRDSTQTA